MLNDCSTFCIALGSNLGDRMHHLRKAVRLMQIRLPKARLLAAAPVYESAPVDCPDGSDAFYNSVVAIESEATPHEVLDVLRKIESDLGRSNEHAYHAPRIIDLDILCAGDQIFQDVRLSLPHPRMTERRFVLQPLADIFPDLLLPGRNESISTLLARLKPEVPPLQRVTRDWT